MSGTKRVRSLIEELDRFIPQRDKHLIIESRASNVLASVINLLSYISENYSEEEADELEKRFMSSIRNKDPNRFIRKIREIKDKDGKNGK